jgi:hypothetical protein
MYTSINQLSHKIHRRVHEESRRQRYFKKLEKTGPLIIYDHDYSQEENDFSPETLPDENVDQLEDLSSTPPLQFVEDYDQSVNADKVNFFISLLSVIFFVFLMFFVRTVE